MERDFFLNIVFTKNSVWTTLSSCRVKIHIHDIVYGLFKNSEYLPQRIFLSDISFVFQSFQMMRDNLWVYLMLVSQAYGFSYLSERNIFYISFLLLKKLQNFLLIIVNLHDLFIIALYEYCTSVV